MKEKDKKNKITSQKSTEEVIVEKVSDTGSGDEKTENKKRFYTETWFIAAVAAAAFVILLTVMITVTLSGGGGVKNLFGGSDGYLDYTSDSLSDYINVKEEDYKGITVTVPIKKPGKSELDNEINKLLAKNRGEAINGANTAVTGETIGIGDDANISYIGYTFDNAGRKMLISGASNYMEADTKTLRQTIGLSSDAFGIGFDAGLVGKKTNGKPGYVSSGAILRDRVMYATVSFVLDNGIAYDNVNVCIDPFDPNFEKLWGKNFYSIFDGITYKYCGMILLTGDTYKTLELEGGGHITYTALTVNYVATKAEYDPISVKSYFSADYSVDELKGKEVYYDVYVESVVKYKPASFDDTFVKEKLGFTEEKLASYAGSTLSEKFKSYYNDKLNDAYESACKSYVEIEMWEQLKKNISVKLYPVSEMDRIYVDLLNEYAASLAEENAAGAGYEDLDAYMRDVLGIEGEGVWEDVLLADIKETVKERLILYSVLRKEKLLPSETEFEKIYEAELKKDFEYANQIYPGRFKDVAAYEDYIIKDRGEVEYKHSVYYYYATEKIMELITIEYVD